MRFLCLHGAGTNGEIFEIQSGGLTQPLESKGHKFKFINGRINAEVEPELKDIFPPPFFNHYPRDIAPGEEFSQSIDYVMRIIEREGPFDGVMGFSQGAALAFGLLLHSAKFHPTAPPLFKMAVFICGAPPFDLSGTEILTRSSGEEYPVKIPTTHIVGKQDSLYSSSMKLYELCDPSKAEFYDHGSKHMIPFDVKNNDAMVAAIERTIAKVRG